MEPMGRLAAIASRQHGVLTRAQAMAAGLTGHQVDGLVRSKWLRVVYRGVYRVAGSPATWHQSVSAACLAAGADALASHRCAATLWDLPIGESPVEVSVPKLRNPRLSGGVVVVHRSSLRPGTRALVKGIPATKPSSTILDLASLVDGEVLEDVLDDAVGRRLVTIPRVRAELVAAGRQGRQGAGQLNDLLVAREAMPRPPQSRFERAVLALIRQHGLPDPEVQYPVQLPDGRLVYLDIAWPPVLFAIEADSYRYHAALNAWSSDRTRNNAVAILGWRLMAVTWQDILRRSGAVMADVRRGLAGLRIS